MSRGLPRSAGGLLAASLLLVGTALFLGDGSSYGPLVWIGTAALVVTVAAMGFVTLQQRRAERMAGMVPDEPPGPASTVMAGARV